MSKATFAMGCFRQPETRYRRVDGVTDATVGYAGGHAGNPTCRQVCTGNTGHAAVVQVEYDPDVVSHDDLLAVFRDNHDPSIRDRQGLDVGSPYRSAIFTRDHAQAQVAPLEVCYPAKAYHRRYIERSGGPCH